MSKRHLRSVILVLAFASQFLVSCTTATVNPTNTVPVPTSTVISLPPTWTTTPSIVPTATIQPTRVPSSTPSLNTPTLTPQVNSPTPGAGGTPTDSAEFVADITIPDGTMMTAGQAFTKTWKLRNNGSSIWTTSYSVIFSQGSQMGVPSASPLTKEVRPGETTDISLNMTAPLTNGSFTASFMLRNTAGKLFGVGQNATGLFWVKINVSNTAGTPGTPIATLTPGTITPSAGGPTLSIASLTIDKTSYTGACPVRLNFTASFTAQGTGSIVYQLEAGTDNPKFTFSLPGSQTAKYTTVGPNKLNTTYYLDIQSSVNGWARFVATGSNTLRSTQANFSITCQ